MVWNSIQSDPLHLKSYNQGLKKLPQNASMLLVDKEEFSWYGTTKHSVDRSQLKYGQHRNCIRHIEHMRVYLSDSYEFISVIICCFLWLILENNLLWSDLCTIEPLCGPVSLKYLRWNAVWFTLHQCEPSVARMNSPLMDELYLVMGIIEWTRRASRIADN